MKRVLVVEDCPDVRVLVARALQADFRVEFAVCLEEARRMIALTPPNLVLLDIQLPDGPGYTLCSELQNRPDTRDLPVVFLTGSKGVDAKVTAFQIGADDYIEKPFHPDELRARVAAHLRKSERAHGARQILVRGCLHLDLTRYRAAIVRDGSEKRLDLTTREFRLLACLAREPERVHSREQLIQAMSDETIVSPRTVDSHLSHVRRKLDGMGPVIEAVRGAGYRLVVRTD